MGKENYWWFFQHIAGMHAEATEINEVKILIQHSIHPGGALGVLPRYRTDCRRGSVVGRSGWCEQELTGCWHARQTTRQRGRGAGALNGTACGAFVRMFMRMSEVLECIRVFRWCLVLLKRKSTCYFCTIHLLFLTDWRADSLATCKYTISLNGKFEIIDSG